MVGNFYRLIHEEITVHQYDVDIVKLRKPIIGPGGAELPSTDTLPDDRRAAQERFIKKFAEKILVEFIKASNDIFQDTPYVFDGYKQLYTTRILHFDDEKNDYSKKVEVDIDGRVSSFMLTIKRVDTVSLNEALDFYNNKSTLNISEKVISVFEVILRFVIGKGYTPHQRKFFDLTQPQHTHKAKICDFVSGMCNVYVFIKF